MKQESVYIIIVNWNGWNDTLECLESLEKLLYHYNHVVVVDNGSTDESLEKLKKAPQKFKLISLKKNYGFAYANNIGIRLAVKNNAKYVFLLNNDTIVARDIIDVLVENMGKYKDAGALGVKVYYYSKPQVFWFAGSFVDREGEFPTHIGLGEKDHGQYDKIQNIPFVNGSAFFARVSAIQKIGLLDERYFHMYEDGDWSTRFIRANYSCLYIPKAKIWHKVHQSTGGQTSTWWYFDARNRLLWTKLNHPEKNLFNTAKPYFFSIINDMKLTMTTSHPKYWPKLLKKIFFEWIAKIIGIFDYLRGYYGDCPRFISRSLY